MEYSKERGLPSLKSKKSYKALIIYEIMVIQSILHSRNWASTQSRKTEEFFGHKVLVILSLGAAQLSGLWIADSSLHAYSLLFYSHKTKMI